MAKAAKKSGRKAKPKLKLTAAQVERLAAFPVVRKRISDALDKKPLSVDISGPGGKYVSFRIRDPKKFHPALYATMSVGEHGTLLRIGTPKSAIKKPAKLRSFLRKIGWDPKKKDWKKRPSDDKRRDTVYQLREGGIIGGSRIQSVLVPKKRVEEVAREFLGRPQVQKVVGAAANPLLATLGINPPKSKKKKRSRKNPKSAKQLIAEARAQLQQAERDIERADPRWDLTAQSIFGAMGKLHSLTSRDYDRHPEAVNLLEKADRFRVKYQNAVRMLEPNPQSKKSGRKKTRSKSSSVRENRGDVPTINIPFRDGQKVSVAKVRSWIKTLPDGPAKNAFSKRFEKCMKQYRRFNQGSEPKDFIYRTVPMGTSPGVTDLDFVVSEGKEWAAPYQVPKHSGKYHKDVDGRYIHAHGESDLDIEIKKPVSRKKLPDRFHTADGKFVGVIPSPNVKITDWYHG